MLSSWSHSQYSHRFQWASRASLRCFCQNADIKNEYCSAWKVNLILVCLPPTPCSGARYCFVYLLDIWSELIWNNASILFPSLCGCSPSAPSSNVYCTGYQGRINLQKLIPRCATHPPQSHTQSVQYLSLSGGQTILTHAIFSDCPICAKTQNTVIRSLISNGAPQCPTFQYFGGWQSFWVFSPPSSLRALWTAIQQTKKKDCSASAHYVLFERTIQ